MIVKQQGKRVYTCPIAGTRPRGKNEEEDKRLTEELLADEKEKAEHVMLVDLARNDMGRVSEFGSDKSNRFHENPILFPRYAHRISGRGTKKRENIIHLIWYHPSFRQEP